MIEKEEWMPQIGEKVDIVKDSNNSWLRKVRRVYGGRIINKQTNNGLLMFKVKYRAPWGSTSGWYQDYQMVPSNE